MTRCVKCGKYTWEDVMELSKIGVSVKDSSICKCGTSTETKNRGINIKHLSEKNFTIGKIKKIVRDTLK